MMCQRNGTSSIAYSEIKEAMAKLGHSDETKEKMSISHTGKTLSDNHKSSLSKSRLGKKMKEEQRLS